MATLNINCKTAFSSADSFVKEQEAKKLAKFNAEVQGILDVISKKIEEASAEGKFGIELMIKKSKSNDTVIQNYLDIKDGKSDLLATSEVFKASIEILRNEGGFFAREYNGANGCSLEIKWEKENYDDTIADDNDECK